MNPARREHDLVLFGASGFVGGLVAEYLAQRLAGTPLRWALAGQNRESLAQARDRIGAPSDLPLLVANAQDQASLDRLARVTAGLITTVGPYQKLGMGMVQACAAAGTDYADLCGEPAWMRAMIDAHDATARASGARILFSCGYDSVPFDLGVHCLQQAALERFGQPLNTVHGRVRATKGGGFSGGTAASLATTREAAERDPRIKVLMADPFALCPGFTGPAQPDGGVIRHDDVLDAWAAPFVMAVINTKNVHRTNLLLGHAYGTDFRYDEMTLTGSGEAGRERAEATAARAQEAASQHRQGQGSSQQDREGGFYDLAFYGTTADGQPLQGKVRGNHDPGYGSTARMIAEIALLQQEDRSAIAGIGTPTSAFGTTLMARFGANGVMRFDLG